MKNKTLERILKEAAIGVGAVAILWSVLNYKSCLQYIKYADKLNYDFVDNAQKYIIHLFRGNAK